MFDVEAARAEQYAVQTNPDDPRHVQVKKHFAAVMWPPWVSAFNRLMMQNIMDPHAAA